MNKLEAKERALVVAEMKEKIGESYFLDVLSKIAETYYSGTENNLPTTDNDWLDTWANNKAELYLMMGREFIIEKEAELSIDRYEMSRIVAEFIKDNLSDKEYSLVRLFLKTITRSGKRSYFDERECHYNGYVTKIKRKSYIEQVEILKANKLNVDIEFLGKTYKKNSKITTMLKDLVPKHKQSDFDVIYSRLLQAFNCSGKIAVSIHPLDYLTMSQNISGWQSCHRLDGEYRVGMISYLCDKYTTISYVANSKESEYKFLPKERNTWNSKKWRQAIFIDPFQETFCQSRQYPDYNRAYDESAFDLVKNIMFEGKDFKIQSTARNKLANAGDSECDSYIKLWITDIVFENSRGAWTHYNDIIHFDSDRTFAIPADKNFSDIEDIEIGYNVKCMCGCGGLVSASDTLYDPYEHSGASNQNLYYDNDDEY